MEAAADCEQDVCALVWGFFGMLRRSQLIGLDVGLVTPVGGAVVVTIRRSRTDQLGQGAQVCWFREDQGSTGRNRDGHGAASG